jgi:FkbM family methyltransferase
MKEKLKNVLLAVLSPLVKLIAAVPGGKLFVEQILHFSMNRSTEIILNDLKLSFAIPNALSRYRIDSFPYKEPETIEWINGIPKGSVLWDIGANIGLYSVYAAKKSDCMVYAFEPSVFNLELLARNIYLNGFSTRICIVPLALSDKLSISPMRMTTTEWGGALSTFGKDFGWDGKAIKSLFDYQLIGLSMENAVSLLQIPLPDYIKMDVDGLEHFILKGGGDVLTKIKGILIEVNDDFAEQAEQCSVLLTAAGMILKEKRHSLEVGDSDSGFQNTYNQIWIRK